MTAISDATTMQRHHSHAQRIAELEQELAKMKTSSTVNTANAFPFGKYGYNVMLCHEPLAGAFCFLPRTVTSASPLSCASVLPGPSAKSAMRQRATYKDVATRVSLDYPMIFCRGTE